DRQIDLRIFRRDQSMLPVYRNDHNRSARRAAGIGTYPGQFPDLLPVRHHIKFPGLLIAGTGSLHTGLQDLKDLLFLNDFVFILSYTDSAKNTVHIQLLLFCLLRSVPANPRFHPSRVTKIPAAIPAAPPAHFAASKAPSSCGAALTVKPR